MSLCRSERERIQADSGGSTGRIVCGYRKLRKDPCFPVQAHLAATIPPAASAAYLLWHTHGALEPELLACRIRERKRSCPMHLVASTTTAGRYMCELLQETFEQRAAIRW